MTGKPDESAPELPSTFPGGACDPTLPFGRATGDLHITYSSVVARIGQDLKIVVPFEGMTIDIDESNGTITSCRSADDKTSTYTSDIRFLHVLARCKHEDTAKIAKGLLKRRIGSGGPSLNVIWIGVAVVVVLAIVLWAVFT